MVQKIDTKIKEADLALKDLELLKNDSEMRHKIIEVSIDKIDILNILLQSSYVYTEGYSSDVKITPTFSEQEKAIIKKKIFELIKKL